MLKGLFSIVLMLGLLLSFSFKGEAANVKVLMKTSMGDITIELYPDKAPISVKNFLSYVDEKKYDGTIFHRVIKGFMIQGGGLTPDFHGIPTKPAIKNEAANGLKNKRGTIAMARTNVVDSATCQFFINHADNAFLDHRDNTPEGFGYCVFGKVVKGMDVVDAIANVKTMMKRGRQDVPRETITIISVSRIE
ncbi:MAG: peptidyl-prolyl cis-trans isomerase [Candidatus Aminicenantes bacterium]|nr:MAG: peptidyl-prolyl cis-trans isomerase [Candidatus Aminicenantes bacterium]